MDLGLLAYAAMYSKMGEPNYEQSALRPISKGHMMNCINPP